MEDMLLVTKIQTLGIKTLNDCIMCMFLELLYRNQYSKWPSQLEVQNISTALLQRGKTPPTSVLDMTLNNLMVRLQ